MKTILNFDEYNEGIVSGLKSGVRKAISFVKNWIDKLFKHPNARPLQVEGGKGVQFILENKPAVKIYDWTDNFKANESVIINEKAVDASDVIPLKYTGQENVDDDELAFLVESLFELKGNLFIFGASAIGKTKIVQRFCKDNGLMLELIALALRDPVDLLGILMPEEGTKFSEARLPNIWPQSNWPGEIPEGKTEEDGPGGIIFFDEINRASESVRGACLSFIGDRAIGTTYTLPSNWVFVSASNRPIDNDAVEDLGPALVGRFEIVNFFPAVEDWLEKSEEFGKLHPHIMAFVKNNPQYFHYLRVDADPNLPFAAPRSWSKASNNYEFWLKLKASNHNLSEEKLRRRLQILISPSIGVPIAIEFVNYVYSILDNSASFEWDKIKLISTNPEQVPLPPKGANDEYVADIAIKVVENILAHLKNTTITEKILKNIDTYLDRLDNFELANSLTTKLIADHKDMLLDDKLITQIDKMLSKNKEYYDVDKETKTN